MKHRVLFILGVAALLAVVSPIPLYGSAEDEEQPRLYRLDPGSALSTSCSGPCVCPPTFAPLRGTFVLRRSAFDGHVATYQVSDVRWTLSDEAPPVRISGSGTYRVGGEFAVQEQMLLDLQVGGNPAQRFDSGPIAGKGEFPAIDIRISLERTTACIDTVIAVKARPAEGPSAPQANHGDAPSRASASTSSGSFTILNVPSLSRGHSSRGRSQ